MTGKAEPRVFRRDRVFPHGVPKPEKVETDPRFLPVSQAFIKAKDLGLLTTEQMLGLEQLGRRR